MKRSFVIAVDCVMVLLTIEPDIIESVTEKIPIGKGTLRIG